MIIDAKILAGKSAYLVDHQLDPDDLNLARFSVVGDDGQPLPRRGALPPLRRGQLLEVLGIDLVLRGPDLMKLLTRQAGPILSAHVEKEMFPGLYADPYAHRVHQVGGREDLERGTSRAVRCLEVEGVPTLVSTGPLAAWASAVYRLPEPMDLTAVWWDLAASKSSVGFAYGAEFDIWQESQDPLADAPTELPLATGAPPDADRFARTDPGKAAKVIAYRLRFKAEVMQDAYLYERHLGPRDAESLGRPLLRGFQVLESVEPAHEFFSLHELMARATDYHLVDEPDGPPRTLRLHLGLTATLGEGESIAVVVHPEYRDALEYVEARLDAKLSLRPAEVLSRA